MSDVGVIAVVSRQTVPILQFLWHIQKSVPELRQVLLLHTDDHDESAGPARRVASLWRESFPTIPCQEAPVGILPQDVREAILRAQECHPTIGRWIVSCTGGLKLMALGAADAIDERTEIRYVEIRSGWHRVRRDEKGFFVGERLAEQPPADVADSIPAARLVATQLGRFDHVPKTLPLDALVADLPGLTRALIEGGWNWRPLFERLGPEWKDQRNGTGFELYVAACLKAMGIENVAWSLVTQLEKTEVHENDLVVWRDGKLTVLDLKLDRRFVKRRREGSSETDLVEVSFAQQVRLASQARKDLGGLGADWVILRPTLTLSESDRALLEAFGITRWLERTHAGQLVTKLREWLGGCDLPEVRTLLEESEDPFCTRNPT